MFYITKHRKAVFTIVFAISVCLALSSFSTITHSQTSNSFTLPCTINTYGNAWNGDLEFDLEIGSGFMGVGGTGNYLVVMDTNGNVLDLRESNSSYGGAAYEIAPDTLLFQGEPQESYGAASAPLFATHIWNLSTGATEDFPNVIGEHDVQYDPVNNTFLTLQDYVRQVGNNLILYDKILQLDPNGNVLWSWDTYNYIPPSEDSPYNETSSFNGQTCEDLTHANSLDWDYTNGIIYLNLRVTNTFYAINQTTGNIIWACGEFGNFTLLGANGQPLPDVTGPNGAILPPSLWYHSHDVKEVAPDVFTMFDNDFDNNTNPDDCHSRMIEVTLNQTSMTAYVNWSWEAPIQYWNYYAGANLLLPNGDFLGDFGDPSHQQPQNSINGQDQSWSFNDTGAVFVEVNPAGQIVKTFTFPVGCYVYRVTTIANPTSGNFPTPTPTSTPTSTATSTATSTSTSTPTSSPVTQIPPITTQNPTQNPATSTPLATATPTLATTSPPITTPTPSILPSSTPNGSISSQIIIMGTALAAVIVVAVILAFVFFIRKRTPNQNNPSPKH